MRSCANCTHAEWDTTTKGRLHPSGDGTCRFPVALPVLPAAMYYVTSPHVGGGAINRRKLLKTDCVHYKVPDGKWRTHG